MMSHRIRARSETAAWAALYLFLILLVGYRLRFGFSLQDEGFYLAAPARYLLGDVPFRDERYTVLRSFDLVTAPLMAVFGTGTVLGWRWAGFAIQLVLLSSTIPLLRRLLPIPTALLVFAATVLFVPFNLWTPNYNNLGVGAAAAGLALWLYAGLPDAKLSIAAAVLGGGLFAICAVAYTPLVMLAGLPIATLAVRDPALRAASGRWSAAFGFGVVGVFAMLWVEGLLSHLMTALADLRALPQYGGSMWERALSGVFGPGVRRATLLGLAAGLAAGGFAVSRVRRAGWKVIPVAALFAIVIVALLLEQSYFKTNSIWLLILNSALVGTASAFALAARKHPGANLRAALLLLACGVACAALLAMTSAAGTRKANVAAWLLWPGAVAVICAGAGSSASEGRVAPGLALVLYIAAAWHLFSWVYWDRPLAVMSTPFSTPALHGVYAAPADVREIDRLVCEIRRRTAPAGYLLDLGAPGITYLTGTRPALRSAIAVADGATARAWLEAMEKEGRTAHVALTLGSPRPQRVLDRYVLAHYRPVARVSRFTVWERTSPIPPKAAHQSNSS